MKLCALYMPGLAPGFMATIHAKPAPCAPTNTSASDVKHHEAPNSWGSGFIVTLSLKPMFWKL